MALTQHTLTVTPTVGGARTATGTWDTNLTNPKLIGAIPVLPTGAAAASFTGVGVRARVDGDVVTVEVSHPAGAGPVDVLVTVDA